MALSSPGPPQRQGGTRETLGASVSTPADVGIQSPPQRLDLHAWIPL